MKNDDPSHNAHTTRTELLTDETNRAEFTKNHTPTIPIDGNAHPARGRGRFHAIRWAWSGRALARRGGGQRSETHTCKPERKRDETSGFYRKPLDKYQRPLYGQLLAIKALSPIRAAIVNANTTEQPTYEEYGPRCSPTNHTHRFNPFPNRNENTMPPPYPEATDTKNRERPRPPD